MYVTVNYSATSSKEAMRFINRFKIDAIFDDDFEITFYMLDAECSQCGTPLTAPTPCDKVKPQRHLRVVR